MMLNYPRKKRGTNFLIPLFLFKDHFVKAKKMVLANYFSSIKGEHCSSFLLFQKLVFARFDYISINSITVAQHDKKFCYNSNLIPCAKGNSVP